MAIIGELDTIRWKKFYREAYTFDNYKIYFASKGLLSIKDKVTVITPNKEILETECFKTDSLFVRSNIAKEIIKKHKEVN